MGSSQKNNGLNLKDNRLRPNTEKGCVRPQSVSLLNLSNKRIHIAPCCLQPSFKSYMYNSSEHVMPNLQHHLHTTQLNHTRQQYLHIPTICQWLLVTSFPQNSHIQLPGPYSCKMAIRKRGPGLPQESYMTKFQESYMTKFQSCTQQTSSSPETRSATVLRRQFRNS